MLPPTIYRANRLRLGVLALVNAVLLAVLLPVAQNSTFLSEDIIAGPAAFLNAVPPTGRSFLLWIAFVLLGLGLVVSVRFLLDNRIVFVDDEGIRVVGLFGSSWGAWGELTDVRRQGVGPIGFVSLRFRYGQVRGKDVARATLGLPSALFGVDTPAILAEAQERMTLATGPFDPLAFPTLQAMPPSRVFGRRRAHN